MFNVINAFISGLRGDHSDPRRRDKQMRSNLSEKQVDKMVKDSFPASDPPSTY